MDYRLDKAARVVRAAETLADAIASAQDCRFLMAQGGLAHPGHTSLWDCPGAPSLKMVPSVDLYLTKLHEVEIFGRSMPFADGRYGVPDDSIDPYTYDYLCAGHVERSWGQMPPFIGSPRRIEADTVFVPFHYLLSIYGHLLVEMLPKLFQIARLAQQGIVYPIVLPRVPHGFDWIARIVGLVCPANPVLVYDPMTEYVAARTAIFLSAPDHFLQPSASADFLNFARAQQGRVGRQGGERLFLPSRHRKSFRRMENELEISRIFKRYGFRTLRPENLPWPQQVRIFHAAEAVAGEMNSTLHNTVFSPAGTKVIAMNPLSDFQAAIAASHGHALGYILPEDGRIRAFNPNDHSEQRYRINPDEVEQRLADLFGPVKTQKTATKGRPVMPSRSTFWDRIAKRYIAGPIRDQAAYERKLELAQACFTPETTLLELGCGSGLTAIRHAPHVASIDAIDYSKEMIAHARHAAKSAGVFNIHFEIAALEDWPINTTYDVVMANSLLHLVPKRAPLLARIVEAMKPGGLFISSTTCLGPMSILRPLIALPSAIGLLPTVAFISADQLKAEIEAAGLTILTHWQPKPKAAHFIIAAKPGVGAAVSLPTS